MNSIEDARGILGVTSARHYLERQAEALAKAGRQAWRSDATVTPYVNHGRWVADCPHCRAGCAVTPEWDVICCLECGAVYESILLPGPAARAAIEAVLEKRFVTRRNWFPHETITDLQCENLAHGVEV